MPDLIFLSSLLLIAYTYGGYPLALALLTRRQRSARNVSESDPALLPQVTLLIAAYNEADVIGTRLENALQLDYPADRLHILVAADGSTDETPALVRQFADRGVELLHRPERRGKMAAINRAMPHARGEIVVFSDANNLYDPPALRRLVRPFTDPRVGAATGAKRIVRGDGALGDSEGLYWRYEAFIKERESRLGSTTGVCGEILAVRRALFIPPPPEIINDDFYLALDLQRRGYDVVYVGDALSRERVSASSADERVRRSRIVAGRYQAMSRPRLLPRRPLLLWQIISHKYLRPLVPLAMIVALVANVLALVTGRRGPLFTGRGAALLLLGQGLFYVAALLGLRLEKASGAGRLLFLPAYLVSSNVAALVGLLRFLHGGTSPRWQRVARRPLREEPRL